jgi:hypothetical protein
VRIHAARRHFVQQRLPDVRWAAIDQNDAGAPRRMPARQTIAKQRGQLQAASPTPDDDDAMRA